MTRQDSETLARRVRRMTGGIVPAAWRVKPLAGARGRRLVQLRKILHPLVKRPIVITSRDGLRMELTIDPVDELVANDLLGRSRSLWFPDPPAEAEREPDIRLVLDLGAHHGFYAVTALARYPRARLIAVEPSQEGAARVRRNLQLNSVDHRARVVEVGLARRAGTGTLLHTDEGSWGNSLFEEEGVTVLDREAVALATLADILGDDRPDVIKCNAEGAEFALVDSLVDSEVRPWLMILMVHPEFGDLDAIAAAVEGLGYVVRHAGTENRPVLQAWRRSVA
jgi:FkbM family methyltransferase